MLNFSDQNVFQKLSGVDSSSDDESLSNSEFMSQVFGRELVDACPVVVSFEGNPANVPGRAWHGSAWQGASDPLPKATENSNNYFSLADFHTGVDGQVRRKKSAFHSLHALMLDDVGSKVAIDRLSLAPSWLIETSPGNFQAGYIFEHPITDGALAENLMQAIIIAGLCDPGANGPQTRMARLPVASNGKRSPAFRCRLACWAPDNRYSVEQLVEGFQLTLKPVQEAKRQSHKKTLGVPPSSTSTLTLAPTENPVIAALQAQGRYRANLGEGKHDITCPWVAEHTDGIDSGAAYFEPSEQSEIGGFKCLHGHCTDRHITDLLSAIQVKPQSMRMLPTIRISGGKLSEIIDAAEVVLAESGQYYQRAGGIVTVVKDPETAEARIQPMSRAPLILALAERAIWERFDRQAQDWVPADPPMHHAEVLLGSLSYSHLPVVKGLARQPCLRSDGSLMREAGYDPLSCMFGVFNPADFNIPERPSRAQAEIALKSLENILREFCFAERSDLSAALCAIFTAVVRSSLSHAPLIHVRSNTSGSGKSFLCDVITTFVSPQKSIPMSFPGDDEECRKLLHSELMKSPAVIQFDNLTIDLLAHNSLCTALTSEYMTGRILGASKTGMVSTRTLLLSSGNNVGPVKDMSRRAITVSLDTKSEMPADREFAQPNLVEDIRKARGEYISAVLTVILAWIVAGRPKTACQSLASFGEWSDICRQPLLWLGHADPAASVFQSMAEDPDRETLGRLLEVWESVFDTMPTRVRDARNRSLCSGDAHVELGEVLHDIAGERGEINTRKLGRWIKRHAGRIVDGRRFVKSNLRLSAEAWQVHRMESVSSISSVSNGNSETNILYERENLASYSAASRGE